MTQPKRDWALARSKLESEQHRCRICKSAEQVQAAHVVGREFDRYDANGQRWVEPWLVLPERIVPLCAEHHRSYDAHMTDLLGHLTPQEEAQAVLDANGLENARVRLCPSAYKVAA